jgi:hypothetical protein
MSNNPEVKPELLPCPCCSERAEACRQGDWHIVECIEVECGLRTGGFTTKEWAIKAWNERPVSQPVEEPNEIKDCHRLLDAIGIPISDNEVLLSLYGRIKRLYDDHIALVAKRLKIHKVEEHIVTDNTATLDNALRENEELKTILKKDKRTMVYIADKFNKENDQLRCSLNEAKGLLKFYRENIGKCPSKWSTVEVIVPQFNKLVEDFISNVQTNPSPYSNARD